MIVKSAADLPDGGLDDRLMGIGNTIDFLEVGDELFAIAYKAASRVGDGFDSKVESLLRMRGENAPISSSETVEEPPEITEIMATARRELELRREKRRMRGYLAARNHVRGYTTDREGKDVENPRNFRVYRGLYRRMRGHRNLIEDSLKYERGGNELRAENWGSVLGYCVEIFDYTAKHPASMESGGFQKMINRNLKVKWKLPLLSSYPTKEQKVEDVYRTLRSMEAENSGVVRSSLSYMERSNPEFLLRLLQK